MFRTENRMDAEMFFANDLFRIPEGVESRWSSFENPKGLKGGACKGDDGRKRRPCSSLKPGESYVMAESKGSSGVVRRIWITLRDRSPEVMRGVRLDFYWDGARKPAVSAPIGDFFCQGLGKAYAFSNELFANPEGRSFLCQVPMPFKKAMKIVITNESSVDAQSFYYDVNYTLGDKLGSDALYFHSHWRRENPTVETEDYEFLPKVKGRGRLLGVNFGVVANSELYGKIWWGEGEVKVFLDGDKGNPTLCGSGTEDYIGTGWGQGKYSLPHVGCPYADWDKMEYAFYRLHIPDPIYFQKDARATIQQIACCGYDSLPQLKWAGLKLTHGDKDVDVERQYELKTHTFFERHDDWSSCVYFYLDKPENGLPALAPVEERIAPARKG